MQIKQMKLPKIIAHRGASADAPENTLASFNKAVELGAKWLEFDVRLTKDEELIVFHDETLDRTTNGIGLVEDHAWAEINALDAGGWFSEKFTGEKVPSFTEVLVFLKANDLGANVEMKLPAGLNELIAQKTIAMLNESGLDQGNILLSSFEFDSLLQARKLSNNINIGLLFEELPDGWRELVKLVKPVSIHLKDKYVTKAVVDNVLSSGVKVLVYTVNEAKRAHQLFEMGVSSIFSDDPDLI